MLMPECIHNHSISLTLHKDWDQNADMPECGFYKLFILPVGYIVEDNGKTCLHSKITMARSVQPMQIWGRIVVHVEPLEFL